jgi:hypothetical protein
MTLTMTELNVRSLVCKFAALMTCSLAIVVPSRSQAQPTSAPPELVKLLRANDEKLLMAVHRGDRHTWADLATADFMYVEEGLVSRRDAFLKELEEDGFAPLIIRNYEVQLLGDTAQVFHEDDVPQRPGAASTKNAHLLMTETWQRVDGKWLLRIVHTDRIRLLPPPVILPENKADELVGTYKNQEQTYVIRRQGDHIMGGKTGAPMKELKAEASDVLFVPDDVYVRKVFQRDAQGHVTGFIDRRENTDRLWSRLGS